MYQFTFSINKENSHWFSEIEKALAVRIKSYNSIMAHQLLGGRLYVSFACENKYKSALNKILHEAIIEIFLRGVKFDYLSEILSLPQLKPEAYKVLLHTLVAFDRDAEKEIIEKHLRLKENLALDGFFNFKLTELKKRWNDIAELAVSNSVYLSNDETLNELLKFLMSAVSPKIIKLNVIKYDDADVYNITGKYSENDFEYKIQSQDKLMEYLINIAPLELNLYGDFYEDKLYKRLVSIFDAKSQAIVT